MLGYLIYSLMYFAIFVMIVDAVGIEGIQQNIEMLWDPIVLVLGLALLNSLLAFGIWRIPTFSYMKKRILLITSIAISVIAVLANASGWWQWYQGGAPGGINLTAIIAGSFGALGYALLAYGLAKYMATSNQALQRTSR